MAFDRTDELSYSKVAALLREDNQDDNVRQLVNYILSLLDYSAAELQAETLSDLATELEAATLA